MEPVTTYGAILGQVLKKLREARNLGQSQMAEQVGVTQPYWSKVEQGKANPSITLVRRSSAALGIPYSQLVAETERACDALSSEGVRILDEEEEEGSDWLPYVGAAALGVFIAIVLNKK